MNIKLYLVFGIEFHVGEYLFGIYDSREKAEIRMANVEPIGYDKIEIREIELNSDFDV
jgi:hypothetical protein